MIVGDTHGNTRVLEVKINLAKRLGVERLMVVGDFGLWPGHEGVRFLDDVNHYAREEDIFVYALPGNHEDHDQWEWWVNGPMAKDKAGFTYARSNILLSPKVHNWKWDKKRFSIAGGAVSIDRQYRIAGKSYWPNETLSEEDLAPIEKYQGPEIDYLFTHDASDYTPWGFSLVPDPESQANRRRLDRAIKALRPRMQFHGHMHRQYEWINRRSHGRYESALGVDDSDYNGASTHTFGLECDSEIFSWGILDTSEDRFYWPNQAMLRYDKD